LARQEPDRFIVVDASADPSNVWDQIFEQLEKCFKI
jgi:thymidylate kinase